MLIDVILEYKRRVNTSYEAEQIIKSGDCYDTPYFTKLVDVVDKNGRVLGKMEIMVKRTPELVESDIFQYQLVAK